MAFKGAKERSVYRILAGIIIGFLLLTGGVSGAVIDVPLGQPTIQAAINAAAAGDTINVSAGIYNENVVVNKSVNLIGAGLGVTIVNASNSSDHVIQVTADWVNVSGFTLTGTAGTGNWPNIYAGLFLNGSNNCNISSINSSNNVAGIRAYFSDNNTIINNVVSNNKFGVRIYYSKNNTLTGNTMSQNTYNFNVYGQNVISYYMHTIGIDNIINGKPIYYLIGVSNFIIDSINNSGYIGIINSFNITIRDLTLSNNDNGVLFVNTSNSTILNVTSSNNLRGLRLITSSNYNTLVNNTVTSTIEIGIDLDSVSYNNLIRNNVNSTESFGLSLVSSSNNTLTSNTITNNSVGIYIESSNNNKIYNNYISNNSLANAQDILGANSWNTSIINATNIIGGPWIGGNFWDDYTGLDLSFPFGIGDTKIPYNSSDNINIGGDYLPLKPLAVGGGPAQITQCTVIDTPGVYLLQNNISDNTNSTCIDITSSDVVFDGQGFTIDGVDTGGTYGVSVYNASFILTNVTVKNLIVSDWTYGIYYRSSQSGRIENSIAPSNQYGIYLYLNSTNNTLLNNTANSNTWYGIWLNDVARNNTLTGNTATNNTVGINMQVFANRNNLSNNDVSSNSQQGIAIAGSSNNILINNTASSNLQYGIWLSSSNNNTIIGSDTSSNGQYGIYLSSSSGNNISSNNASYNKLGIYLTSSSSNILIKNRADSNANWQGIWLEWNSHFNIVEDNTANSNNYDGIYVSDSNNNTLINNTANSNLRNGIYLQTANSNLLKSNTFNLNNWKGLFLDWSFNNTISSNIADSNNLTGIHLQTSSDNNTVYSNRMINNNQSGIYIDFTNNTIYNNFFNNTVNYDLSGAGFNLWNTTISSGTNIIGGPDLGGNFWAYPNGTGYSETCTDSNFNGICDNPFILATNNIDYLPLTIPSGGSVTNCTVISYSGVYVLQNDILNSSNSTCINILSSDVVFDGQGYTIDGTETCCQNGIYAHGTFASHITNVTVKNVTVSDWFYGIRYSYVDNSTGSIRDNTATSNPAYGIYLSSSTNITISNNNITNNSDGISLWDSHYNKLINNNASANDFNGIYLSVSNYNTIEDNEIKSNDFGIFLDSCGECLPDSWYNTIRGNNVSDNQYGIYLDWAPMFNIIYNNYVSDNNFSNAFDDNGNNYWNSTPKSGTNIIGGSKMGGNYWSDYLGGDANGDTLGDTILPYNSGGDIISGGDYHPLTTNAVDLRRPAVNSLVLSKKRILLGQNISALANVTDDLGVDKVRLRVTLIQPLTDSEVPLVATKVFNMTQIGGIGSDFYGLNLTPPTWGAYILTVVASDTTGNLNNTVKRRLIVDNFEPLPPKNFINGTSATTNTSDNDVKLDILPKANLANIIINITRSRNVNESLNRPLNRTYGLGSGQHSLEKFVTIDVPPELNNPKNLTWAVLRISYNVSDLDRTGDGDANDPDDLNPSTLRMYWYYTTNDTWIKLETGTNLTTIGGPFVFRTWVDTTNRFVAVNISRFSVYGLGASVAGGGASVAGGGASVLPRGVTGTGIVKITRSIFISLVRQFNYFGERFQASAAELWGSFGALGSYQAPPEFQGQLNDITHPYDVEFIDGDVYEISSRRAIEEFSAGVDTAIIARGDLGLDSLAATSYARILKIPILLVEPNSIPGPTLDAINRLGVKSVIIVGGQEAVSEELSSLLPQPTRIWGENRYETSVRIAEALLEDNKITTLVVTDGENPESTTVMVASFYDAPIVYMRGSEVPEPTRRFLSRNTFRKVIAVGLSEEAQKSLKKAVD